jgi:hypothetical protein
MSTSETGEGEGNGNDQSPSTSSPSSSPAEAEGAEEKETMASTTYSLFVAAVAIGLIGFVGALFLYAPGPGDSTFQKVSYWSTVVLSPSLGAFSFYFAISHLFAGGRGKAVLWSGALTGLFAGSFVFLTVSTGGTTDNVKAAYIVGAFALVSAALLAAALLRAVGIASVYRRVGATCLASLLAFSTAFSAFFEEGSGGSGPEECFSIEGTYQGLYENRGTGETGRTIIKIQEDCEYDAYIDGERYGQGVADYDGGEVTFDGGLEATLNGSVLSGRTETVTGEIIFKLQQTH